MLYCSRETPLSRGRPGKPPPRLVIVDPKRNPRPLAPFTLEPGRIQPDQHAPSFRPVFTGHLPASPATLGAKPPVGITPGRLPPAVPATVHHAAVEYPPEVQLEIVVLRGWRPVAPGIQAHHEVVAPVRGRIGDARGDEQGVGRPDQPDQRGSLTGPDAHRGRAQRRCVDRSGWGRRPGNVPQPKGI